MEIHNFNKEWAQGKTEAEFVAQHKHLGTEKELKAMYAKLVSKKEPEKGV